MKTLTLLTLALLSFATCAAEPDGATLEKSQRCYSCHDLTKTLIGPPYKAIAARHAADKEMMVEVLARKILRGGGGNWGVVPMVPNEHVSEADARTLARWVLSQ